MESVVGEELDRGKDRPRKIPAGYLARFFRGCLGQSLCHHADFVRIGVPLNLLCLVVALVVIPRVWPLQAP